MLFNHFLIKASNKLTLVSEHKNPFGLSRQQVFTLQTSAHSWKVLGSIPSLDKEPFWVELASSP